MPRGLPRKCEEDDMSTARIRVVLMGAVLATACGNSPTAPERARVPGATLTLAYGQTGTAPGTELRVSLLSTYVLGAAASSCVASVPCNFSPSVTLRVEAPGAAAENRLAHIPNPMGGDVFAYGSYRVRVRGLEPAWDERAPRDGSTYKVLLSVYRE
jgi:hypothetical protein